MFSSRLRWSLEPNALACLLKGKRQAGSRLVDLTESNPTRAGFHYPAEILEALASPENLIYEPSPFGLAKARQLIARLAGARPQQVVLTASTSESYSYLFKLLCDAGDAVCTPQPSYPLFEFLAALENVEVISYRLAFERRWSIDFDSLEEALSERVRAVFVVNPNNPTGSYLTREEGRRLSELCARRRIALVSDEVFYPYALQARPEPDVLAPAAAATLTVRLDGLSKRVGLPQMKLGWMIVDGPQPLLAEALERMEVIADTYLSVATPVQHALPQLLTHGAQVREQIAARTKENLGWLQAHANPLPVEGGWYALIPLPAGTDELELVLRLLEEDNVLLQPGFFYDLPEDSFVVVSLLAQPEVFRAGLEALIRRLPGARAASRPSFRVPPSSR